jgi:RNA polymerase sigma-70 factor (ECF subfamily)
MDDAEFLAERFEADRTHLRAVAYQMLGSASEADDAVQEAWIRLNRADTTHVENLSGWLTTVVARVCLDILRSRRSRREDRLDSLEPAATTADPEQQAIMADSVGPALLVVLETLAPAERIAFVLHDVFAVPFDEIATIVGRTPTAARQLASRARRRVQGASAPGADVAREREVATAFLAAARDGDFAALLALLDPDVVFVHEATEVRGAAAVAELFAGRARVTHPALIDGLVGVVVGPRVRPAMVLDLEFTDGRIAAIDVVADADMVADFDVQFFDG